MGSYTRTLALTAGMALALIASRPAAAQAPEGCAPDIGKFCPTVPAGGGRVLACLQEHEYELAPECKEGLKKATRPAKRRRYAHDRPKAAWVSPCMGDIKKLCRGVPAGAGRIAECLQQQQAELSIACKTAFQPKPAK